jgi:hypothetical protein
VRQRHGEWWLFVSRVATPWPAIELVGYQPIAIDPAILASFFERIVGMSLPISPDLSGMGGADGTVSQIAVFGDVYSECRFQWWSPPPAQWQPLADLAVEMVAAFSAAGGQNA